VPSDGYYRYGGGVCRLIARQLGAAFERGSEQQVVEGVAAEAKSRLGELEPSHGPAEVQLGVGYAGGRSSEEVWGYAQLLEQGQDLGGEKFPANFVAGEAGLLVEHHSRSSSAEGQRRRGAGGTAA